MKRILTILALSLLCLTSNAQLVWKISGNGIKKPSYILGTHHGCPFTYCDSIPGLMKAFDKVDNIIGEINMIEFAEMSPERMQKMQAMIRFMSECVRTYTQNRLRNCLKHLTHHPLRQKLRT